MKYRNLGYSDTKVSQICLGSMTWGTQNTPAEAFEQIDMALEHGVNFIDTAEMYPATPISKETQGRTEEIMGQWFKTSGRRDEVVLATKVAGPGHTWIDDGKDIDAAKIKKAIDRSLTRLQTDYIDLYQLHWPNRGSYHFRQWSEFDPTQQNKTSTCEHIHEVLLALNDLVKAGKIREIGLSNETCWGTSQFLQIAEQEHLPRVVTTQNEYNLMCRLFDLDFAELAHNENVGLLAFSPLAAGMLSGKYDNGGLPAGSRRTINNDLSGRYTENSQSVLKQYTQLARDNNLQPANLAIAFCLTRPFMTSAIIGATNREQLLNNIQAADTELDDSILSAITEIYKMSPMPM